MIPTPHTVGVKRYQAGAKDDLGNDVDSWADTALELPAHFVAPATSAEPFQPNRALLTTDKTVGAPKHANLPGPRDIVVWQGEEYTVEGEVADYTNGPWANPAAGVTFVIRKMAG